MGVFDQMRAEYMSQREARNGGGSGREATTEIGGTTVELEQSQTVTELSDSFLVSDEGGKYGVPRGVEAYEARQIARTQPMQLIVNAINDQLTGGDLTYPSEDDDLDQAEAELAALVDDVLRGPHLDGADFDDLVAAIVADLVGPGNAYLETLSAPGVDIPVAGLKPVDPLTIRHNVDLTRTPLDPPYFQAPFRTRGGSIASMGGLEPTPLQQEDLVVMSYPGSYRSDRIYPLSPAMQVKDWLEVIADSTIHHSRYYRDNELPPGLLTAANAGQNDIDNMKESLEDAKGDPRSAPVVGTDARWVEVGGSAVDLNVIEEQKWFLRLVAAAFGIPQTELSILEDANRAEGDNQLSIVHKRVTNPLSEMIGESITRQVVGQFHLYNRFDKPFQVALQFSDPRQERAQERFVRQRYRDGLATYREARGDIGEGDQDDDTSVVINGTVVDYGEHPLHVQKALLKDAQSDDVDEPSVDSPTDEDEDGDTGQGADA